MTHIFRLDEASSLTDEVHLDISPVFIFTKNPLVLVFTVLKASAVKIGQLLIACNHLKLIIKKKQR